MALCVVFVQSAKQSNNFEQNSLVARVRTRVWRGQNDFVAVSERAKCVKWVEPQSTRVVMDERAIRVFAWATCQHLQLFENSGGPTNVIISSGRNYAEQNQGQLFVFPDQKGPTNIWCKKGRKPVTLLVDNLRSPCMNSPK
jgi:hypothetical protein